MQHRKLIDNTILVTQEAISRYRYHFLGFDKNPEVDLKYRGVANQSRTKWQKCSYSHYTLTPTANTEKQEQFTDICFARPNCQRNCCKNFGGLSYGLVLTTERLLERKIEKPDSKIRETLEEEKKTYDWT